MHPFEWAIIGAMWGIVIALVAYVWNDLIKRVATIDHPVDGKIASLEGELRRRFHAVEKDVTTGNVRVEEFGRDIADLRSSLKESARDLREIQSKLDRVLGRLSGRDSQGEVD